MESIKNHKVLILRGIKLQFNMGQICQLTNMVVLSLESFPVKQKTSILTTLKICITSIIFIARKNHCLALVMKEDSTLVASIFHGSISAWCFLPSVGMLKIPGSTQLTTATSEAPKYGILFLSAINKNLMILLKRNMVRKMWSIKLHIWSTL